MISPAEMRRDGGFTLLEVIVVLVIAGLLIGLALERGPFRSSVVTFGAARSKILHILRTAQERALTSGQPVSVSMDLNRRDLVVTAGRIVKKDRLTGPVHLRLALPNGGVMIRGIFHFLPDGTASGPPLELSFGQERELITISPVTGRIMAHVQ